MLSDKQVEDIFLSEDKTADIAARHGISTNSVRAIKRRETHQDVTRLFPQPGRHMSTNRPILDDATVRAIYEFTGNPQELKAKFGISKRVAMNIKFRITYSGHSGITGLPGEIKLYKLTWDDVCTIRASSLSSAVLAELFGVSKSTINNIRSGRTRTLK